MKKLFCICITVVMLTAMLSACTNKAPQPISEDDNATVEVGSVKELLDAIEPDADIVIKPGYYNLSDYIESEWKNDGDKWNESHKYVKLSECFDGVEVTIERVDGISIKGGGKTTAATEIVTKPRYAAVFNFKDCRDIKLSSLTMGHTDGGDCSGNVINFTECKNIELRNMDIYGCGVYGIGAYDGTENMIMYDSTIRDCFYGPFEMYGCSGKFEFYDSVFNDSDGYSWIESEPDMKVSFYRCEFGDKETEYFMFAEDVYTEDCTFSENIEVYPDYSDSDEDDDQPDYMEKLPDFTNMEVVPFDKEVVADTSWTGAYAVILENGNSFHLPSYGDDGREANISVRIDADGKGIMNYYDNLIGFAWHCDSDYSMSLELDDGTTSNAIMHTEKKEGTKPLWLLVHIGETAVWMHMNK